MLSFSDMEYRQKLVQGCYPCVPGPIKSRSWCGDIKVIFIVSTFYLTDKIVLKVILRKIYIQKKLQFFYIRHYAQLSLTNQGNKKSHNVFYKIQIQLQYVCHKNINSHLTIECYSPHRAGALSRFCIGSLKSANSVGNINTVESLQKNTKQQFASRQKGLCHFWQLSGLYIYSLYLYIYYQYYYFLA